MTTTETIPPKRKRFRLSIRALMLAVLTLALGLGWVVHRAKVQHDAVAAIQKAGGKVYYEWHRAPSGGLNLKWEPPWPKWLVGWLGVDYFGKVIIVQFGREATDADLAQVAGLTSLEDLNLMDSQVTDAGLAHLAKLVKLKSLRISCAGVTGTGLAHLGGMKQLWSLNLRRANVADLSALPDLPSLVHLVLDQNPVDDSQVATLTRFPSVFILGLNDTKITDVSLDRLAPWQNLASLEVRQTAITDAGLTRLRTNQPRLSIMQDLTSRAQTASKNASTNPGPQP